MTMTAEGLDFVSRLIAACEYYFVALDKEDEVLGDATALAVPNSGAVRFSGEMAGIARPIARFELRRKAGSAFVPMAEPVTIAQFSVLTPKVSADNSFKIVYTIPLGGDCNDC